MRPALRIVLDIPARFVVAEAHDVESTVVACDRRPTQVAVLDPWLGADVDGVRSVRLVAAVRVLVFTGRCSGNSVLEAMRAGAASYVLDDAARLLRVSDGAVKSHLARFFSKTGGVPHRVGGDRASPGYLP